MLNATGAFSGFATNDIAAAKRFYGDMERYEGQPQDERGIMHEWGPPIAWFTDPAGNVLSVIQTGSA